MTEERNTLLTRRNVIRTAGSAAVVGGGLALLSDDASAQVDTGVFDVSDTTVEADAGLIESLVISEVDVRAEYEGFNYAVDTVDFQLDVTHNGVSETREDVLSATIPHSDQNPSGQSFEGTVTTMLTDDSGSSKIDLVDMFGQESFEVFEGSGINTNDVTRDFEITFELTATVSDVEGNTLSDTATGDSISTVTNLATAVSVGGTAAVSVTEDTEGPRPQGYGRSIPAKANNAQATALQSVTLADPFTLTVVDSDKAGTSSTNYGVTAYYGAYDEAPSDSLSGPAVPLEYDSEGVATVTIGTAGSGADVTTGLAPGSLSSDINEVDNISLPGTPDGVYVETE